MGVVVCPRLSKHGFDGPETEGLMVVTTQDMYFSWVLPGTLAGCRAPWRNAVVEFLREQGILTLVRLQEVERLRVTADGYIQPHPLMGKVERKQRDLLNKKWEEENKWKKKNEEWQNVYENNRKWSG